MDPLTFLQTGEISIEGQFLWGSNYTLLVDVQCGTERVQAVYKPTRGVRPLWDFDPPTLARRETLAFLVSRQLNWDLVPPTVIRSDGPLGPGSLQLFIEHDPEQHFFTLPAEERQSLRPAAVFDILINNADRKGGHFILDADRHIWLIDHGVCFHEEPKLRTVLWDFAEEPLPEDLTAGLAEFRRALEPDTAFYQLAQQHISRREIDAMTRRTDELLVERVFPTPPSHTRPYPWPLV